MPQRIRLIESLDLEDVTLGAAIHALAERFGDEPDTERLVEHEPDRIEAVVRRGAADGVAQLLERFEEGTRASREMLKRVDALRQ